MDRSSGKYSNCKSTYVYTDNRSLQDCVKAAKTHLPSPETGGDGVPTTVNFLEHENGNTVCYLKECANELELQLISDTLGYDVHTRLCNSGKFYNLKIHTTCLLS